MENGSESSIFNEMLDNSVIRQHRKRKNSPKVDGKENQNESSSESKAKCFKFDVKWAIKPDAINDIMTDMGVGVLDENSNSSDKNDVNNEPSSSKELNSSLNSSHSDHDRSFDIYAVKNDSSPDTDIKEQFLRRRKRSLYREDHSSKISDEVILNIFRWLPKCVLVICAQTCRRWKRLAFDEALWKRLDAGRKQLNPGDVGRILARGVQALRLSVAEISVPIFPEPFIKQNPNFESKVKFLDLSMAAITVSGLRELLSVCSQLRKLSLENCSLDDSVCTEISKNKNLHTLNLCICRGLTSNGIKEIVSKCRSLTELNIGWTNLKECAVTYLTQNLPSTIKRLNLSGMKNTLKDEGIEDLTVTCPNLIDLDISDCSDLSSSTIHHITYRMTCIRSLCVNRCYSIPINDYLMLKKIDTLQRLEIYGLLNNDSLITLKKSLSKIQVNKTLFSTIARPTTGISRSSIWGIKVRD